MKKLIVRFLFLAILLPALTYSQETRNNNNVVVLVKYKTQPGKGDAATQALLKLLDKVRNEPNYVSIILHIDPADSSNILLYEEWAKEEYYRTEHMRTPHLVQFMNDAKTFLAGPPEI